MIKVNELMMRHFDNLPNDFKHEITNAVSAGLNSKNTALQTISSRILQHPKLLYQNSVLLRHAQHAYHPKP